MSASSSTASGSPAWAASVTSGPVSRVTSPPTRALRSWATGESASTSSRASRTSALPEAYCSQQPRLPHSQRWPVRHDLHVPELAGHPVLATEHLVVDHQRAADAGPERDAQDVAVPDARAEPALRERGGVRVVVHHHRDGDPLHQRGPQRLVAPGEVRREQHGRAGGVDEPGRPDADRRDVVLRAQGVDQLDDGVLDVAHAAAGGGPALAGEHRAEGVDDPGEDLGAADVDADRQRTGRARSSRVGCRGGRSRAWSRDYCAGVILRPCAHSGGRPSSSSRSWPPCWSPPPAWPPTGPRRRSAG